MLGYMLFRKEELRFREFDRYRAFYCGLCHAVGARCGPAGRAALSYEMTFLSILLTSLYDDPAVDAPRRCLVHPVRKHASLTGGAIAYCADLSAMLAYHDRMDGWRDGRKVAGLASAALLRRGAEEAGARLPRQKAALDAYLRDLHAAEARREPNLDCAASLAGRMLSELYVMREDAYAQDLRALGFAVGKFIALADSYEDLEEDRKRGTYNPLLAIADREGFADEAESMLSAVLAPGAEAFERLPVIEDAELLRNILYSGVWQRVERARLRREGKEQRQA